MTLICIKCGLPCYVHDGGAYCPVHGAVDVEIAEHVDEDSHGVG
jgi:uncharacterized Zn finger protein (UPF0148 family)